MGVLSRLSLGVFFGLGLLGKVVLSEENASTTESAESGETAKAVHTLTTGNFDTFLEENELVLVEFYAPWCGHCKNLAPEYEKAAQRLKESGSKVQLGAVDATVESSLGERFGIRGYPTLKFFRGGEPEEYSGGRTVDTIVEWITLMTGPALTHYEDAAAADKAFSSENMGVAFVGTFPAKEGAAYDAFHKVASQSRKLGRFLAVITSGATEGVIVRRAEEGEVAAEAVTEDALKKFVASESLPFFGPINGDNFQQYHEKDREMAWFCGSAADYEAVKGAMREAAKEHRETYSLVWLDTEGYQAHAEKALGITEFPGLVLQTKAGRYVYPGLTTATTGKEVLAFIADVKAGKIEKSLKSEEIPTSQDDAVQTVVGKNMEEMVYQTDKDVYFMVYAPWCGHCKKFAPTYEEFAKSQADNKHLLVSKMDGTLNESPIEDFEWTGFPSVFFVKAGTRTPTRYDGDRTMEGLTEHLKKQGTPATAWTDTGKSEEL